MIPFARKIIIQHSNLSKDQKSEIYSLEPITAHRYAKDIITSGLNYYKHDIESSTAKLFR